MSDDQMYEMAHEQIKALGEKVETQATKVRYRRGFWAGFSWGIPTGLLLSLVLHGIAHAQEHPYLRSIGGTPEAPVIEVVPDTLFKAITVAPVAAGYMFIVNKDQPEMIALVLVTKDGTPIAAIPGATVGWLGFGKLLGVAAREAAPAEKTQ